MAWIESHQEIAGHPKTRRLAKKLGITRRDAIGLLHLLWWWCLDYAQDGDLGKIEPDIIADAVDHEGDPDELVAALVYSGYADRAEGTLTVHDWSDYAERMMTALEMRREATRLRTKKWRELKAQKQAQNSPGDATHKESDASGDAGDAAVTNDGDAAVTPVTFLSDAPVTLGDAPTGPNLTGPDRTGPDSTGPDRLLVPTPEVLSGGASHKKKKPQKNDPIIPVSLIVFDAMMADAPGYETKEATLRKIEEYVEHTGADTEAEALRIKSWLGEPKQVKEKRTASTMFLLNWFDPRRGKWWRPNGDVRGGATTNGRSVAGETGRPGQGAPVGTGVYAKYIRRD